MKRTCWKCKVNKPITDFYKHSQSTGGYLGKCKDCVKKTVSNYSKNNPEKIKSYEVTRNRFNIQRNFNHRYNAIKRRCEKGRSNGTKVIVTGMKYLSKEEFMKWCYQKENYSSFIRLHNKWVASGFKRRLVPSIDRINSKLSYEIGNLQWLSLVDNIKKEYD